MVIIKWRDSFNTGVEQFDAEHRKIVEYINTIFESILNKQDKHSSIEVINGLLSYTSYHFDNEEAVMKKYSYPFSEHHIEEHALLKISVLQFQTAIEDDFIKARSDLYLFMRDWMINHILEVDRKLAVYILDNEPPL